MRKVEKVKQDKKDWKTNGLSDLEDKYKVINKTKYNDIENVDHIRVELFV